MTTWAAMTRAQVPTDEVSYQHSPTGRAVLLSLVPVICPVEAAGCAEAIVDHVALTLGAAPPLLRKGFGAGLATYDLGALPRYRRRARFLTGERAERYYDSWAHGPTPIHTQFAHALNQLMSLACYEQPEMAARIGYAPGPWIEEVTKKRLSVFRDDVRKQDAQILAPDPLRPGVYVGRRKKAGG
ncbi:MAG: hypothetical protein H0V17_23950 [Deltaproteobacteria bacterium]|nr:hypothetical protein [Deltaproteobacteria bacterium]